MNIKGLRSILPLSPESLRGVTPAEDIGEPPVFEWIDPRDLFVEDGYQRDVGENGIKQVRRIYAGFDWSRFKPPVCVKVPQWDDVLVCIDGQHTAIAAASHPKIPKIPVMIVSAADAADRANAFVGHNRDRLGLTQMAIYYAEIAAGEPLALKMAAALRDSGAEILKKSVNLKQKLPPGKTVAVGIIRTIAKDHGSVFLTQVLKVLVAAGRGPIKADEIGAVALVLQTRLPGEQVERVGARLAELVGSRSAEAWAASVAQELAEKGGSLPRMLAKVWSQEIGFWPDAQAPPLGGHRNILSGAIPTEARRPSPEPSKPSTPAISPATQKNAPAASVEARTADLKPGKPPEPQKQVAIAGADQSRMVTRNGVTLDLLTRELTHRGAVIRVPSDDGVRLVACLARVMPALLDEARVRKATFGEVGPDTVPQLRRLVELIAPALAKASLEVKFLPKIGVRLNDLGE